MASENFSYEQFCSYFPVSRETYQQFETYVSLIKKWQASVNLVSDSTLPLLWVRHIIDSYQLLEHIPSSNLLIDMGAGAGLPGIVLAIAGRNVSLIESDGKKVAFLREVARALSLSVSIYHQRVESVSLQNASIITARAFAPVATILSLLHKELTSAHRLLLLKGKIYQQEIAEAEKDYQFEWKTFPSITDISGVILLLYNIKPRGVKVV